MKKILFIAIFLTGLGIFLYPIISNQFATTVHQSEIKKTQEVVSQMTEEEIVKEKEKIDLHNKELAESDLNFVDPFSNDGEGDEEGSGTTSYYDALNIGPSIGSISIPKINVDLPIYHGTSEKVLSRGAGHLENSSLPTSRVGTHSVITAHRGLPSAKLFRNLDKLNVGDRFFVEVLDEKIAYEVEDIKVVLPSETDWLKIDERENKMTLLTCDPYMINTHRMLVTGKKVPYKDADYEKVAVGLQKSNIAYYIVGSLVAMLLLIMFVKRRKKKVK